MPLMPSSSRHTRRRSSGPCGARRTSRSEAGPRPIVHAAHPVDGPPPPDRGEGEEHADEPEPGARGGEGRAETPVRNLFAGRGDQAAQENSEVERPVLPSYAMPKA